MELIVRGPRHYHVSQDTVTEFENAILSDTRVVPAAMNGVAASAIVAAFAGISRLGFDPGSIVRRIPGRRATLDPQRDYLAVMMGLDIAKCAPWFALPARRNVYLFDAWPSKHEQIRRFVTSWGVQYAFVSSSQVQKRLSMMCDNCTFIWIPEGVDAIEYKPRSWIEKDIDVLQLGRQHERYHELIFPASGESRFVYLYEKNRGEIIFPERRDFIAGLGRSKISVCFPSSATHPERAGDVETMTVRYLQSIASKCIIVGRAPAEMVELFGYNPVIDADMTNPAAQIESILRDYQNYIPLVEKNFETVRLHHTWTRRWERMASILLPSLH